MSNFSERFKEVRTRLGLTQVEIANALNFDQKNISHWERGRNEPSSKALKAFCDKYSVNLNWLLTGQGEMFFSPSTSGGEPINPTIIRAIDKLTRELQGVKQNLKPAGSLTPVFTGVTKYPLVKNIRAGEVSAIIDISEEMISVPDSWKGKGDFCVQISGNSMKEEHILDGMIVLIKKIPVPSPNDIVLVTGYDVPEELCGVLKKVKYMNENNFMLVNGSGQVMDNGDGYQIIGKVCKWMIP